MKPWRLGIDLGSNSLGWAALTLGDNGEPVALMDWGVRIFPDGREPTSARKVGASLAVARRLARGMRRNRDRKQSRVRHFAHALIDYGLAPNTQISPYQARHDAAMGPVNAGVLGRALLHLCRRRGFLSNRKTDGEDTENSQRKIEMGALKNYLDTNSLTLGQFLHHRETQGLSLRFRSLPAVTVPYNGVAHPAYPTRAMYAEEFTTIRTAQGNTFLDDEQWDNLAHTLFFQRPLKPQDPGQCTFEDAPRASKHLPLAHTFRIVQEVNNLRYACNGALHDLTLQQKKQLYELLDAQQEMKFSSMRTKLKLSKDACFNLESERRKGLKGNEVAVAMRKVFSAHNCQWDGLSSEVQHAVITTIITANDAEDFVHNNTQQQWNLPHELLHAISNISFSSSFCSLSVQAMRKILPFMEQGMQYWEAATQAYGGHTAERIETGEVLAQLPYYGEVLPKSTTPIRKSPTANAEELQYGRIPNPTVHVALNQLRHVVNALLRRFGNPYEVHIELARDLKNNAKKRQEIEKEIAKATAEREANIQLLQACGIQHFSADDLLKIRLWKELAEAPDADGSGGMARIDIYTGQTISLRQCMSDEVEVEHILPFSRSYDDTIANKTVTFRHVNREKGNSSPAEYLQRNAGPMYEAALQRAQHQLKGSKRWRFQTDAMDIYERAALSRLSSAEKEQFFDGAGGAFIARQLKDTQYMARIAASYLVPIVGTTHRIIPVNGKMTALLRHKWQLGFAKQKGTDKERSDHRHHAVDALVVALASRGMLKRIASTTAAIQEQTHDYRAKLFVPMPEWLGCAKNSELEARYASIAISFRLDHTCEGRLFQDTAYGFLPTGDQASGKYNAVTRRALIALKEKELDQIRDVPLRTAMQSLFCSPAYARLKWEEKLAKLAVDGMILGKTRQFIRHVRILVTNQSIRAIASAPYKGYAADSWAFCDVWKVPVTNKHKIFQGKFTYQASYVSFIDAIECKNNDKGLFAKHKPHPAAKHCMRLYKNDMVLLTVDGKEQLMRVAGFSTTNNSIDLRPHTETQGNNKYYSVNKTMAEQHLRKVFVTPDGRLLGL